MELQVVMLENTLLNGLFLIDDTKDADATNNHSKVAENASTNVLEPNKDWLEEKGDKFDKAKQGYKRKRFYYRRY